MAIPIGAGVTLNNIHQENFMYTFKVSGNVTTSDVGKAVSLDTTAANTVKLAGDGDPIFGRLEVYEDRVQEGIKVGTVSTKGGLKFPLAANANVSIGTYLVGGGAGAVKAAGANVVNRFQAVEVIGTTSTVAVVQ